MRKKVYKEKAQSRQEQFPDDSEKRGRQEPPGTISLEEAKALLGDPSPTDQEVKEIKEQVRLMVEIIYEKWLQDQQKRDNQTE